MIHNDLGHYGTLWDIMGHYGTLFETSIGKIDVIFQSECHWRSFEINELSKEDVKFFSIDPVTGSKPMKKITIFEKRNHAMTTSLRIMSSTLENDICLKYLSVWM